MTEEEKNVTIDMRDTSSTLPGCPMIEHTFDNTIISESISKRLSQLAASSK